MTTDHTNSNISVDIIDGKLVLLSSTPFKHYESVKRVLNDHYTNGLSKYVEKISIKVVDNIDECKKIWQKFCKNETLFDSWDFRYQFFKGYKIKPYFLTIVKGSDILACLPLMYQEYLQQYTWFGSDWMEDNRFFTVNKNYVPLLLYLAPRPLILAGLDTNEITGVPGFVEFKPDDSNYFIDLSLHGNMDNYLMSLPKKKRYNLKRDYRIISTLDPIFIRGKKLKQQFFSIIQERMHSLGKRAYFEEDHGNKLAFESLFNYSGNEFKIDMWSVLIDNDLAVCDMIAVHKNTIYPLMGGNNIKKYSGVGNYINYCEIERAFQEGYEKINYLQICYGWKNKYLMESPRYLIELK